MKKNKVTKVIRIILASVLGLCLVFVAAFYLISGGFMKQSYMEPWSKNYAANYSDPRIRLAASGLLAASGHNMQPWVIKLDVNDSTSFYLYADSTRLTKEVDPYARQMMISQGTFLEYVLVAGEKDGLNVDIKLFPDGEYDESKLVESMNTMPVAKITLTQAKAQSQALTQTQSQNIVLYDATFLPDTNREAYKADPLLSTQISVLESLSSESGVLIKLYQDPDNLKKIGDYAIQSATIEAGVKSVMDESSAIFRANEYQKNKFRYGYSVEGQGTSGFMKNILQGLVTLFPSMNEGDTASQNFISYTKTSVNNTPAYAMIVTSGNSRIEQVESGMLYSELVLTAHTLGLAMQPLSQVLEEYPQMNDPYTSFQNTYAQSGGTVQMLFRIGTPTKSTPLSMRRDVLELISEEK